LQQAYIFKSKSVFEITFKPQKDLNKYLTSATITKQITMILDSQSAKE